MTQAFNMSKPSPDDREWHGKVGGVFFWLIAGFTAVVMLLTPVLGLLSRGSSHSAPTSVSQQTSGGAPSRSR